MRSLFATLAVAVSYIGLVSAAQGQLQQMSNFGANPNNVGMYYYRPPNLQTNPALIVAIHYCTGSAQAYFSGSPYANQADQRRNFMVIYPDAPRSGKCFDVHSPETLRHDGGGDSLGIASAVRYAISTWGVDPNRVFVTGTSSGAMMTNVMIGAYPDLFKAATTYAGVPYACFAGAGEWSSQCANGQLIRTGQQWGDLVRAAYPGYTGPRPKIQFWHGTNDETLNYQNFREMIKQWTNVFGVSETPSSTQQNTPSSGTTKTTYGPNIEAFSIQGAPHNIQINVAYDMAWFGLDGSTPTTQPPTTQPPTTQPPTTQPPTTQPPTTQPPTTQPPTGGAAHWGQCGGIGWNGPTTCESPWTCQKINDWYFQCL